ncbi:MAG: hypothetical protein M5U34_43780 [Chloroflexi bacterium]|nr:hypothetical protein [Chloroflexota bacterium]
MVWGTLFVTPSHAKIPVMGEKNLYHNADQAHAFAMQQLDYYRRLADEVDYLRLVTDRESLEAVVASHEEGSAAPCSAWFLSWKGPTPSASRKRRRIGTNVVYAPLAWPGMTPATPLAAGLTPTKA